MVSEQFSIMNYEFFIDTSSAIHSSSSYFNDSNLWRTFDFKGYSLFQSTSKNSFPYFLRFYNGLPLVSFTQFSDVLEAPFGLVFTSSHREDGATQGSVQYLTAYIPSFSRPLSYDMYCLEVFIASFSTLDEAIQFYYGNYLSYPSIEVFRSTPHPPYLYDNEVYSFRLYVLPYCCYPDFAPITKVLGGTVSTNQFLNLKTICQLLGIDTSTSLNNCEAMKDYLKRIVSILGGSPLSEPNLNLKSICQLLGVSTLENGLKDCDLSKEYVKRISKGLGA